jgi:hypothetical protein
LALSTQAALAPYFALQAALTNTTVLTSFTGNTRWARDAAAMTDRTREERLQIMLSPEELSGLDDFRFKKRMPSRAAAVRELLKRGLAAEGFSAAPFGSKSSEFGVIGKTPPGRR